MHYRRFLIYNVIGGTLWGCGITILGYFLGQVAFVKSNIELILVGIVVVSVIPAVVEYFRGRRDARGRAPADH
jgi:membrane-associated protein